MAHLPQGVWASLRLTVYDLLPLFDVITRPLPLMGRNVTAPPNLPEWSASHGPTPLDANITQRTLDFKGLGPWSGLMITKLKDL